MKTVIAYYSIRASMVSQMCWFDGDSGELLDIVETDARKGRRAITAAAQHRLDIPQNQSPFTGAFLCPLPEKYIGLLG